MQPAKKRKRLRIIKIFPGHLILMRQGGINKPVKICPGREVKMAQAARVEAQ